MPSQKIQGIGETNVSSIEHSSPSAHLSGTSDFLVNKNIAFWDPPFIRRESLSINRSECPAVAKSSGAALIRTVLEIKSIIYNLEHGSILVVISEFCFW